MDRHRVRARIDSIVSSASGVTGAAIFGSVAQRRDDDFSDLDLLVRCDEATAHGLVAEWDAALGIVLHRAFSARRRPSGRYWFRSAHPFQRLDVSFHDAETFDRILEVGGEFAQPPFLALPPGPSRRDIAASPGRRWTQAEEEYALAIRHFHETTKALVRGSRPKRPLDTVVRGIEEARSADLDADAWGLYERSRTALSAAGLELPSGSAHRARSDPGGRLWSRPPRPTGSG